MTTEENTKFLRAVECKNTGREFPVIEPFKIEEDLTEISQLSPSPTAKEYKIEATVGFRAEIDHRVPVSNVKREALRAIAHYVYGDVGYKLRECYPLLMELRATHNETAHELANKIDEIIRMIEP